MIALIAAVSIAIKPIMIILGGVVTQSILPDGVVSGAIYMIWIVLPCLITKKRGTAILVGVIQSCLIIVFGMLGNRGVFNLPVYIVPCIFMELIMLLNRNYISGFISCFIAGGIVNMTGAFIIGFFFLNLYFIPLIVSLAIAFCSGGVGGLIAYRLYKTVFKLTVNQNREEVL